MSEPVYVFNGFRLEPGARQLVDPSGVAVHVERQVFDVLVTLVANHDRVVTKIELLDEVWGDRFVSDSAVTSRIKSARRAVDDDGRKQQVVATVHGIGYRFVAEVDRAGSDAVGGDTATATVTAAAMSDDTATAADAATRPAPVPAPNDLIGRDGDVDELAAMLGQHRLVTVVGAGGLGKTQLAQTVGHRVGVGYESTVMVRLAGVAGGEAIGGALLEAIGATNQPGLSAVESSIRSLAGHSVLLLLDNAERVRHDLAQLVRTMLERCPDVTMLVTSRQRLNVAGEHVHRLHPLDEAQSLQLFGRVAAAAGADLDLEDQGLVSLCRRLDGVPLAIELLASRTPLLSPADLDRDLAGFLANEVERDGEDDHASVAAALAWSLADLEPEIRNLLFDLTVTTSTFDLEAATAIGGSSRALEGLLDLCERSLVVAQPQGGRSLFRILEPVRLLAGASADAATLAAARDRHLTYHLERAEALAQELRFTPAVDEAIAELRRLWPNLRVIFTKARFSGDGRSMGRLIAALTDLTELQLTSEVQGWADTLLAAVEAGEIERSEGHDDVVAARARIGFQTGDLAGAAELLDSIDDAVDSPIVAMARVWGAFYRDQLTPDSPVLRAAADEVAGTGGLAELSLLAIEVYRSAGAGEPETWATARAIAAASRGGQTAKLIATLARASGRWMNRTDGSGDGGALELLEEAMEVSIDLGHAMIAGAALSFRAVVLASISDTGLAMEGFRRQVAYLASNGLWTMIVADAPMVAKVLTDVGEDELAARLLGLRSASAYAGRISELIAGMMVAVLEERLGDGLAPLLADGGRWSVEAAAAETMATIDRHLAA